jgi:SOS response regulatory protein OraA/RecX
MKITSLINKNYRVQIFIDEKYSFSSSINFVIENQLHVDKDLNDEELDRLKSLAYQSILKQKLLEYITSGNYSKKELFRKVNNYSKRRYNLEPSQELFDKKFKEVVDSKIYNENTIIQSLINLYLAKSKGRNFIVQKLIQKGFSKQQFEEILGSFDNEDLNKKLKGFLEKKLPSLQKKAKDKYDLKSKLIKSAMDRGFDYREIKSEVEQILQN